MAMCAGTYTIVVSGMRGSKDRGEFTSEAYDTSAVVVGDVNNYVVGETAEFTSKLCSFFTGYLMCR